MKYFLYWGYVAIIVKNKRTELVVTVVEHEGPDDLQAALNGDKVGDFTVITYGNLSDRNREFNEWDRAMMNDFLDEWDKENENA